MLAPATESRSERAWPGSGARPVPTAGAVATLLVLATGVGLRLYRPDLAQVNFDESNVASLVAGWKYQGLFPLAGTISSYGFRAAEGWPWFVALGLLPTDDPYALIAVGIAAGLAGLLACWWVARRWLGTWGGVAAALAHGTMFYCVLLERGVWLPVLLQAPMALCLDALLRLGVRRQPWALVVACGWLGVLVGLHYTAIAFVAVVPVAAWFARRSLRPIHLVTAVLVGVLPLVPFLAFEVNPTAHFADLAELLSLSRGTSTLDLATVTSTIQVASTQGALGLGGHASAEVVAELGRWTSFSLLYPLLAGIGLVVALVARPRGPTGWLIALWTLAPVVAYLRHGAPLIFHYMYIEFVGLAMCIGVLGAWASRQRWRPVRIAVAGCLGVAAVASALSMLVVLRMLDRFDMSAGYGVPIGYSRAAGDAARSALPPGGIVLVGDDPHSGEVLRFTVGYQIPSQTFDDCLGVPDVSNAIYVLASEQTPGRQALEAAGAPLLALVPRPGGDAYRVYGPPASVPANDHLSVDATAAQNNPICRDRSVWDAS